MRKYAGKASTILMMSVLLLFVMAACGAGSGSDEGTAEIKWPAMETLSSLSASDITHVEYSRATEDGFKSDITGDPSEIEDIYLRLKDVSITEETNEDVLDDDLGLTVEAGDKKLSFTFMGDVLALEDGSRYKVENLGSLKSYVDKLLESAVEPKEAPQDAKDYKDKTETSGSDSTAGSGSSDYDVSKGFQKQTNSDGSIEYLYFNDFLITMPGNEKWSFEMNGDSVTFYLFSAQQEGYGGKLVTIKAYDMDDNSYEQLPSYHVAGVGRNVNKRFIAIYPTDVQWNGADSEQDADYRDLKDYLWKIGEGAVNSPLQTADSDPAPVD